MSESSTSGSFDCRDRLLVSVLEKLAAMSDPENNYPPRYDGKWDEAKEVLGEEVVEIVKEYLEEEIEGRAEGRYGYLCEESIEELSRLLQKQLVYWIEGDLDYPEEFCLDSGRADEKVLKSMSTDFARQVFEQMITPDSKEQWLERCRMSMSGHALENDSSCLAKEIFNIMSVKKNAGT